ncbi:MAG: tRNA lysidine(34) synthetase TilS [Oscillospiraceae bacterium]|nr:tRNA lysidine(34) synthetase TilS [Oscillospiraceae bacterium]
MLNKIQQTIQAYSMLTLGERVCVALSGGADSVCLALVLKKLGYDVFCVHVNHNLRGDESKRDEEFCHGFCKANSLDLFVESVDVKAFCAESKRSLEDGARHLRYEALNKYCKGVKLATAHNLNDCLETTVFNLTRGCGLKGLLGVPPVRDNIIRPLIRTTRDEIEAYLSTLGQAYVTDSTNLVDDCSRNIIRLNVLPELLKINGGLLKTYEAELNSWQEAEDHLNDLALSVFENCKADGEYDLSEIYDQAVLSKVISYILNENKIPVSNERITAIKNILLYDGKINIQKGVYIIAASGRLTITDSAANEKLFKEILIGDEVSIGDKKVVITQLSRFDISAHNKNSLKWFLDAEKLVGSTVLRSYSGNEKIKLYCKDFTSVIKKLFAKIPPEKRNLQVVISDDLGAVFVEGFGAAERACVDENTKITLSVRIINN